MDKPTYWACIDCKQNCMILTLDKGYEPEVCAVTGDDCNWHNITRDEFLRRDSLLNDPSHIVQSMDKTPGLWRKEELTGKVPVIKPNYQVGISREVAENYMNSFVKTDMWKSFMEFQEAIRSKPFRMGIDPTTLGEDRSITVTTTDRIPKVPLSYQSYIEQLSKEAANGQKSQDEPTQKFKVGDRVEVTDRILYWIEKLGWDNRMSQFIGKTTTISYLTNIKKYANQTGCFVWCLSKFGYSWPEDCLKKV
jgi:hypothetical protein